MFKTSKKTTETQSDTCIRTRNRYFCAAGTKYTIRLSILKNKYNHRTNDQTHSSCNACYRCIRAKCF
jgi:hypothetical protein